MLQMPELQRPPRVGPCPLPNKAAIAPQPHIVHGWGHLGPQWALRVAQAWLGARGARHLPPLQPTMAHRGLPQGATQARGDP